MFAKAACSCSNPMVAEAACSWICAEFSFNISEVRWIIVEVVVFSAVI